MEVDNTPTQDDMDSSDDVRFIFGLLDDIDKHIDVTLPAGT